MGRQTTPAGAGRDLPGPESARWFRITAGVLLAGLLLAHTVLALNRPAQALENGATAVATGVLGIVVVLAQVARTGHRRPLFVMLGLLQVLGVTGSAMAWAAVVQDRAAPLPGSADMIAVAVTTLLVVAVVVQAWPQVRTTSTRTRLDFAVGALCCAAGYAALVLPRAIEGSPGSDAGELLTTAQAVAGLALCASVAGVLTLRSGALEWTYCWLTTAALTVAGAVTLDPAQAPGAVFGSDSGGGLLVDTALALAVVPALHTDRQELRRNPPPPVSNHRLRHLFVLLSVLLVVYGALAAGGLPTTAVLLAVACLLAASWRTRIGVAELRSLAQTQRQAYTDELTQLFNRRYLDEQMQRVLTGRSPQAPLAVMVMDLEGFKAINETFGHHIGDEVLRQAATRIGQELRRGDIAARLGGDEFGILLPDCAAHGAAVVAERVLAAVEQPFTVDGETHHAGGSIGIAVFPEHGIEMTTLVQHADDAMRHARGTRPGVTVYDRREHQRNRGVLNVQNALDRHELVVHYQPQYHLPDGRMSGVEALVRWNHPERGLLYPDAFLPFFEKSALMAELTVEVLSVALADRQTWSAAGRHLDLSINLPPTALLNPDLVPEVSRLLHRLGTGPAGLVFEITENAMMFDIERAQRTLAELRALGLELSLDDYGTGYCSLTYLRDLPLQEIKVDRSFVGRLAHGTPDADIVASTLDLAHRRGLRAVAEGVENLEAWDLLCEMGCDLAQGYLMSRPVPLTALLALPLMAAPAAERSAAVGAVGRDAGVAASEISGPPDASDASTARYPDVPGTSP